jgi:methionyl-tRNA synthetase
MATLSIPISKAGKGATFEVDSSDLDEAMDSNPELMKALIVEGLKSFLNSRMSKLAAPTKLEGEDLVAAKTEALAKAAENYADLKAGKLVKRTTSKSSSKEAKEVLTEALRECKEVVRDRLKAAKVRISTVAAKDITAAAKKLFAEREEFYISKAKSTLSKREAEAQSEAEVVDAALPQPDPKLVAKLEAEKVERKAATSVKQAGMVTKRAGKGKGPVPPRKGDTPAHQTQH